MKLASATPALEVTGPWAPFAFTPDLLWSATVSTGVHEEAATV